MSQITVPLSWSEIVFASSAGAARRITALRDKQRPKDGARDENAWDGDINGCIAELACAKWAGIFWSGMVGIIGTADVGKWQVRSKIVPGHRLVVKPGDKDHEVFISVLLNLKQPNAVMCGWLHAHEAKRPEWLHQYPGKPPMYWVEDQHLHDMAELRGVQQLRITIAPKDEKDAARILANVGGLLEGHLYGNTDGGL